MTVFVSYRHDGSTPYVGRLYDALSRRFGPSRVFMDVATIEPGRKFAEAIHESIASSQVVLAVMGDQWLAATDAAGRRRLWDPDDWVRLELQTALDAGLPVIPVLIEGAALPAAGDLPEELAGLVQHQAVRLTNAGWVQEIDRLLSSIDELLQSPEPLEPAGDDFRYDAYVSYSDEPADGAWVWDTLVPRLQQQGLRVAVSGDAAEPGVDRIVGVQQGIVDARRTILVISLAYLRDHVADFENVLAQTIGVDEGTYRIVPVTLPGVGGMRLPPRLSMLTTLALDDSTRGERNLQRLIAALKGPLPRR